MVLIAVFIPSLSAANSRVKIAAAGDISCPEYLQSVSWQRSRSPILCQGPQVAEQIKSQSPDHVLGLGDLTQRQGTMEAFEDLRRDWRPIFSLIRPVIGNHDYLKNVPGPAGANQYYRFWKQYKLNDRYLGPPQRLWSTWSSGGVRFIALNSNCDRVGCGPNSSQAVWLRNVLRADRARRKRAKSNFLPCTVAYFHHPIVSAGIPSGRLTDNIKSLRELWRILYAYRTDLVLNGHQHFYERHARIDHWGKTNPKGPVQIISGTGGFSTWAPEDSVTGEPAPSSRFALQSTGALIVDFNNNRWSSYFLTVDGQKVDPVATSCSNKR